VNTVKFSFKVKPDIKFNELKITVLKLKNNLHNYLNFIEQIKQQHYITRQKHFFYKFFCAKNPKKITNQACAKKLHELLSCYLQNENIIFTNLKNVQNKNAVFSAINEFIFKFSNVLTEFYGIGDEYNYLSKPIVFDELTKNIRECLLAINNYIAPHIYLEYQNNLEAIAKLNSVIKNKAGSFIFHSKKVHMRDLLLLTNFLREHIQTILGTVQGATPIAPENAEF